MRLVNKHLGGINYWPIPIRDLSVLPVRSPLFGSSEPGLFPNCGNPLLNACEQVNFRLRPKTWSGERVTLALRSGDLTRFQNIACALLPDAGAMLAYGAAHSQEGKLPLRDLYLPRGIL